MNYIKNVPSSASVLLGSISSLVIASKIVDPFMINKNQTSTHYKEVCVLGRAT